MAKKKYEVINGVKTRIGEGEPVDWITVNGRHIPIFEGQSHSDAILWSVYSSKKDNTDNKKEDSEKERQIKTNKEQADKKTKEEKEREGDQRIGSYRLSELRMSDDEYEQYVKDRLVKMGWKEKTAEAEAKQSVSDRAQDKSDFIKRGLLSLEDAWGQKRKK